MKDFPNGFSNWQETHYEIVSMLTLAYERGNIPLSIFIEVGGTGGLYELAESLTDKFELKNKDREWDGEFFEEIEAFFGQELEAL